MEKVPIISTAFVKNVILQISNCIMRVLVSENSSLITSVSSSSSLSTANPYSTERRGILQIQDVVLKSTQNQKSYPTETMESHLVSPVVKGSWSITLSTVLCKALTNDGLKLEHFTSSRVCTGIPHFTRLAKQLGNRKGTSTSISLSPWMFCNLIYFIWTQHIGSVSNEVSKSVGKT